MQRSADPAGYVDEATAALAGGNVFVSREVSGSSALADTLAEQIGDASIGVAVFSDNAALEASGPDIVAEIATQTGFDTIIVAVGDDLSAGSNVLERGEAMRIANESEDAGSVEAALVETVQGVIAASDSVPGPAPDAGVDGGAIVGVALAVAAVLAAGGVVFGVVRSRRRKAATNGSAPEGVRQQVQKLRSLAIEYGAVGAAGNETAMQVAWDVDKIAANTTELFDRLGRKGGDEAQLGIAEVEYGDTLRKVTAALDRDYLLDILKHPDLWDDPAERVLEVRTAVTAFSTELVENIKQVNARRGLHFQVSLDGLIGRRKELQEWDREFGRAAGDDAGPAARGG
ncbi:hypothetical protein [Microbacterium sp. 2FI]|uniref:hypothetical protein n=1 Tax=Microbacterium sp. 2FI TaxID=2502193 RepID=UPI0010F74F76|nr:hypothetical protein [Microbacterium sp. 2FI]